MSIMLTEEKLRQWAPRARDDYIAGFLASEDVLRHAGILDNLERWAAFMGNVGAETGYLTIARENMRYSARNLLRVWPKRYPRTAAGRAKAALHARRGAKFIANYNYGFRLGNRGRHTDDGYNFRGWGLLQTTGREMFARLGDEMGFSLVDNPKYLDTIDGLTFTAAAITWTRQRHIGNLNDYADRGQFMACCNGINRGNPRSRYKPIGWAHRVAARKKALQVWGQGASDDGVLDLGEHGPDVLRMQLRLSELGYHLGTASGRFLDGTEDAVERFQKRNGLQIDGRVGPKTRAALFSHEALPAAVAQARACASVRDVKAISSTARRADGAKTAGKVALSTLLGASSLASSTTPAGAPAAPVDLASLADKAGEVAGQISRLEQITTTVFTSVRTLGTMLLEHPWLMIILLAGAGYAWRSGHKALVSTVEDHRDDKHRGRVGSGALMAPEDDKISRAEGDD